jgi:hypothetical protein
MFEIGTICRKSLKKSGKNESLLSKIQFPANFPGIRKSIFLGISRKPGTGKPGKETLERRKYDVR